MTAKEAIRIVHECIDSKLTNSGADVIIQDALLKQIPVQPKPDDQYYGNGVCPSCCAVFLDKSTNYCGNCGQRLDWGNTTERGGISHAD